MNFYTKPAIQMLKATLKLHFPYAVFSYKTSTTDGVTTLTITFGGELDIATFADMLEAQEASYLKIQYTGKSLQLI
jgi:hypothetical protein